MFAPSPGPVAGLWARPGTVPIIVHCVGPYCCVAARPVNVSSARGTRTPSRTVGDFARIELALYSAVMAERADIDELARRYLDLWQDQMTALAGDREFAEALQQLMTTMSVPGSAPGSVPGSAPGHAAPEFQRAWMGVMTGQQPGQQPGQSTKATADDGTPGRAPGAPAAATAPDGGSADLDQLARRLAALEERIAALEAGAKPSRGGARSKSRKPRS
jgi:hypothetical protein